MLFSGDAKSDDCFRRELNVLYTKCQYVISFWLSVTPIVVSYIRKVASYELRSVFWWSLMYSILIPM